MDGGSTLTSFSAVLFFGFVLLIIDEGAGEV